jgi:hypothetical protein
MNGLFLLGVSGFAFMYLKFGEWMIFKPTLSIINVHVTFIAKALTRIFMICRMTFYAFIIFIRPLAFFKLAISAIHRFSFNVIFDMIGVASKQLKVIQLIVKGISVLMMNYFFSRKFSAKYLFHQISVQLRPVSLVTSSANSHTNFHMNPSSCFIDIGASNWNGLLMSASARVGAKGRFFNFIRPFFNNLLSTSLTILDWSFFHVVNYTRTDNNSLLLVGAI